MLFLSLGKLVIFVYISNINTVIILKKILRLLELLYDSKIIYDLK